MNAIQFRHLDILTPETAAEAASRLLTQELHLKTQPELDLESYSKELLEMGRNHGDDYYGVLIGTKQVIAAAAVRHAFGAEHNATLVWEFAVDPERRMQGYGSLLLKHLALAAEARGDEVLLVDSLEHSFFQQHGFQEDKSRATDTRLKAPIASVLQRQLATKSGRIPGLHSA